MTATTNMVSAFFYRALSAVAIAAPMLLIFAVSQLPEGTERGELMVYGLGTVVIALVTALVLRAAYASGFQKGLTKASKVAGSERNRYVTA